MRKLLIPIAALAMLSAAPAKADVFNLTSCHITNAACNPGFVSAVDAFGSVTLTQAGGDVNVVVTLFNGNRFVETGAGGKDLFDFNDAIPGSQLTAATATLNGVPQPLIGLTGGTNSFPFQADGFGDFTAFIACAANTSCNGGSTPAMNDLHFTVSNISLAQLETANASGVMFLAAGRRNLDVPVV